MRERGRNWNIMKKKREGTSRKGNLRKRRVSNLGGSNLKELGRGKE